MALEFARAGETEALAEMIRHGLPPNLADEKGNTLLMLSAYKGSCQTARILLEAGAEVDRRNRRGQTPLGGVAFKGYEDIVRLLLEYGADMDADNGGGMTPMMFAAMFGRSNVVALLKKHAEGQGRRERLGLAARLLILLAAPLRMLFGRKAVRSAV